MTFTWSMDGLLQTLSTWNIPLIELLQIHKNLLRIKNLVTYIINQKWMLIIIMIWGFCVLNGFTIQNLSKAQLKIFDGIFDSTFLTAKSKDINNTFLPCGSSRRHLLFHFTLIIYILERPYSWQALHIGTKIFQHLKFYFYFIFSLSWSYCCQIFKIIISL